MLLDRETGLMPTLISADQQGAPPPTASLTGERLAAPTL